MSESRLKVKVVPGASRTKVVGWLGAELKVSVAAPPEGGKANRAVCEVVAAALEVPGSAVTVAGGLTRPRKVLKVVGLTEKEIVARLVAKGVG